MRFLIPISCLVLLVVARQVAGNVELVQPKLESFAEDNLASTGLKYADYLAAYEQITTGMTPKEIDELREESPRFALFMDFIVTPMQRWHPEASDDESLKEAYQKRMEYAYKRFWPAYEDHELLGDELAYNGKKSILFSQAMQELVDDKPDLKLWRVASDEYKSIKSRSEELVKHMDIYEHLDDYQAFVNYLNQPGVHGFMNVYADRFNKCKTEEEMERAVQELRDELGMNDDEDFDDAEEDFED